jgi:hypothetical protein
VVKAEKLHLISGDTVGKGDTDPAERFQIGTYVLLQNRHKTKFKTPRLGPYKVIKNHPFGTNALTTLDGRVLRNLVHNNRLVQYRAKSEHEARQTWNKLRREVLQGEEDKHDVNPDDMLDEEQEQFRELSTLTKEEWNSLQLGWSHSPELVARLGPRAFQRAPAGSQRETPRQEPEMVKVDLAKRSRDAMSVMARREKIPLRDAFERQFNVGRLTDRSEPQKLVNPALQQHETAVS